MGIDELLSAVGDTEGDTELLDLCRKKFLHGTPYVFDGRDDEFYEFRRRIADKFNILFHEIFITGSAKLGFSPHKRTQFSYDSDIDIAIVSEDLYEKIMDRVRQYQMRLREAKATVSTREIKMYHLFLEYSAMGWIRPDKLPLSFQVEEFKNDWFKFFESISHGHSEVGDYKVSAGVFKSYRHLELYVLSGIKQLKSSLEVEERA